MNPLALYCRQAGGSVSGSDRSFDKGEQLDLQEKLKAQGIEIFAQDGQGLCKTTSSLVVSSAVEKANPEISRALNLNIPVLHRSDALALLVQNRQTLAVSGTSGKSTTTALLHHLLYCCNLEPGMYAGAASLGLQKRQGWGQFEVGKGPLVIEADESDGTLIKYHPKGAIITNIQRDHKEIPDLIALFRQFIFQCTDFVVFNASDTLLSSLIAQVKDESFQIKAAKSVATEDQGGLKKLPRFASFSHQGLQVKGQFLKLEACAVEGGWEINHENSKGFLPLPGKHNLENAFAALTVLCEFNIPLSQSLIHLKSFEGVYRRFQIVGRSSKFCVLDDFAHNPDKVRAVLRTTTQLLHKHHWGKRLLVHFQPHGYGPLKMLAQDFIHAFREELPAQSQLILSPVYDAGGSADRSYRTQDFAEAMRTAGACDFTISTPKNRTELLDFVKHIKLEGDLLLNIGARDPSLANLAEQFWNLLKS